MISTARVMFSNSKFSHLKSVLERKASFNVCTTQDMANRKLKSEVLAFLHDFFILS